MLNGNIVEANQNEQKNKGKGVNYLMIRMFWSTFKKIGTSWILTLNFKDKWALPHFKILGDFD